MPVAVAVDAVVDDVFGKHLHHADFPGPGANCVLTGSKSPCSNRSSAAKICGRKMCGRRQSWASVTSASSVL
jgi:hypothetical protein